MSEYSDELARVEARRQAEWQRQKLELRARRLLGAAGWDATAKQLRAAAAGLSEADRIEDDQLEPAIARALELQADENVRGRRLRPEEITMAKPTIDTPTRKKIRAFVLEQRRADGGLKAPELLAKVCEKFGVQITPENFYQTYWSKVTKELEQAATNGKAPAAEKAAEAKPAARQPATTESAPPSEPVPPAAAGAPYFRLMPLTDGRVRVALDVTVDPRGAAVLTNQIGAALFNISSAR